MGPLNRLIRLIPLILSLYFSISFGQTEIGPKEKDIKSLFFNPRVGSEEIRMVVVLPIHSEGEGVKHAPRITDLLMANLRTVGKYDIIPAQDLKGLVEKRGMDLTKIHHYTQALEIGKSLGADGVIMGSLSEYGMMGERAQFGLNLRMIRIAEGDTVWSMSCSAKGKPKEVQDIANDGIESIIRTLAHRWQLEGDTIAWGIKLPPLEASGRYRHITISIPEYRGTDIKEYIVSRAISESGPYKEIKRLSTKKRASFSFKDGDIQPDWTYYYRYHVLTKKGFISPVSEAASAATRGIPLSPQGLKAKGGMVKSILIEWKPPPDPEVRGYIIYRSSSPAGPFVEIQKMRGKNKSSFLDGGTVKEKLTDGTPYYYRIRSYNKVNMLSQESEIIFARTKKVPHVPLGLKALGGQAKRISLSWDPNPEKDIRHYVIYRSDDVANGYKKITAEPGDKTDFADTKLADGTTYYYRIRAVDVDGLESELSETVSVTTKALPSIPKGIKAEGGRGKVTLSWEANPEVDITRYHIYKEKTLGFKKIGFTEGISYTDKNLRDGKTYTYKITAVDRDGLESPFSQEISATTALK